MPTRIPKHPPDPDDVSCLKTLRIYNARIAELAMELIEIAAPGAKVEAGTAAREAQAAAETSRAEAALRETPEFAERMASLAREERQRAKLSPREIIASFDELPKSAKSPIAIFIACSRIVRFCTGVDIKTSAGIAAAHTTAEQAGLHHPARAEILKTLHAGVRNAENPYPSEPELHNNIEIAVTEELGRDPTWNPAELTEHVASRYRLKLNGEPRPPHNAPQFPGEHWTNAPGITPAELKQRWKTHQAEAILKSAKLE